jgi:hypothetical protein
MNATRHVLVLSLLAAACTTASAPPSEPVAAPASAGAAATEAPAPVAAGSRYRSTPGTLPMPAPSPAGPPGTITVAAATYGGNCDGATGNVTNYLAASCNGKTSCQYKVDYVAIGDPAMGCSKDYVATWHCGDAAAVREHKAPGEAGYGAVISLSCAP